MASDATEEPPAILPVTAVYGGGGVFGIGYALGVLEALVDGGIPLAGVPTIGTSAGSWAGAALALGIGFRDAVDAVGHHATRRPDPRRGVLRAIAADVFGDDTRCPQLRAVACALPSLRRTLLSAAEHPVADVVAASSSVPGLVAPHRLGGVAYLDGGLRSMTSTDLAPPAQRLVLVVPLGGAMFGAASRVIERRARSELAGWRRANPDATVVVARPDATMARLARRPDHLFDARRARDVHELAYAQGVALRAAWDRWPHATSGPSHADVDRQAGG